jgi:hypothetical protein
MSETLPRHVAQALEESGLPARKYRRCRFIPVVCGELVDLLARHVEPDEHAHRLYREVCAALAAAVHREYHERLLRLKTWYGPFDPDVDVTSIGKSTADDPERRTREIVGEIKFLLEKANFHTLDRGDVDAAVSAVSPWGLNLRVDLDVFDHLQVWARGEKIDHRTRRSWTTLFRRKHYRIPLYQRLMIVFQPHGEQLDTAGYEHRRIYLKLFKNIPDGDVDMVLPGTSVRMTMLDRGKIAFPIVSGLVMTAWKIIKGALVVAAVGIYGLIAYAMLIVATVGYGWRSFFGYKRTKEKYQLNLTQNLYYQKLDANLGAVLRLSDEAEDQEFREALVAWFLLWRQAPHDGWLMEELDRSAERLLQAELKRDVDFDVSDAVDKLIHWGMIDVQNDGRLTARSPEKVLARLRQFNGALK